MEGEDGIGNWEEMRRRVEGKMKKQGVELERLSGGIEEVDRLARGLYVTST